jgi:hypothetical protein
MTSAISAVDVTVSAPPPGPAQVADDRRQRGGHDRLVQRGQQQAEQDRDEHDVHLHPGQFQAGRLSSVLGRGLVGVGHRDLAHPSVLP